MSLTENRLRWHPHGADSFDAAVFLAERHAWSRPRLNQGRRMGYVLQRDDDRCNLNPQHRTFGQAVAERALP